MKERDKAVFLAHFIVVAMVSLLVVQPLRDRQSPDGLETDAQIEASETQLAGAKRSFLKAQQEVETKKTRLRESIGTLRFSKSTEAPVDTFLRDLYRIAKDSGIEVKSTAPLPPRDSGLVELKGVQCQMSLPDEPTLTTFLNGMARSEGEGLEPMLHAMSLSRSGARLDLSLDLTILTKKSDHEIFEDIQSQSSKYRNCYLLQAPPPPAPPPMRPSRSLPPTLATTAQAAAGEPAPEEVPEPDLPVAPPPPPPLTVTLVGVATLDGHDVALLNQGSGMEFVPVGQVVSGWTLTEVHARYAVFAHEESVERVYLTVTDKPDTKPPTAGEDPPAEPPPIEPSGPPPGAPPSLGLRGGFELALGARPAPPPFHMLTRVYVVKTVDPHLIADRSDIRAGDRILAIDGTPLRIEGQLRVLKSRLAAGEAARLDIERNQSIVSLKIKI